MFDGADTVVLYEELAFQDVLPVLWRPMPSSADRDMAAISAGIAGQHHAEYPRIEPVDLAQQDVPVQPRHPHV